jgi:hypothetical protein
MWSLVFAKAGIVTLVKNETKNANMKNGILLVYGST